VSEGVVTVYCLSLISSHHNYWNISGTHRQHLVLDSWRLSAQQKWLHSTPAPPPPSPRRSGDDKDPCLLTWLPTAPACSGAPSPGSPPLRRAPAHLFCLPTVPARSFHPLPSSLSRSPQDARPLPPSLTPAAEESGETVELGMRAGDSALGIEAEAQGLFSAGFAAAATARWRAPHRRPTTPVVQAHEPDQSLWDAGEDAHLRQVGRVASLWNGLSTPLPTHWYASCCSLLQ
jgi:hypothetical protein